MKEPKDIIQRLIDNASSGDVIKFSELCKKNPQQIRDWKSGHRKPTLTNFLMIINELKSKKIKIDFNKIFDL